MVQQLIHLHHLSSVFHEHSPYLGPSMLPGVEPFDAGYIHPLETSERPGHEVEIALDSSAGILAIVVSRLDIARQGKSSGRSDFQNEGRLLSLPRRTTPSYMLNAEDLPQSASTAERAEMNINQSCLAWIELVDYRRKTFSSCSARPLDRTAQSKVEEVLVSSAVVILEDAPNRGELTACIGQMS